MTDINTVVDQNRRLIYSIISKFRHYYDMEDLYQVGMMGLLKAYQNYDESYDNKFSTYAHTYIWGEVLKYIREDKNIKVSKEMLKLSRSIDHAREVLAQRLMRIPTIQELSLFLEIEEQQIIEADQSKEFVRSLDMALNDDDDGKELNLYDSVPFEEKGYDPMILDLHQELSKLPENEKKLIQYRYFDDKTQSETSELLGMNQVQVSRNEAKILMKLQQRLGA